MSPLASSLISTEVSAGSVDDVYQRRLFSIHSRRSGAQSFVCMGPLPLWSCPYCDLCCDRKPWVTWAYVGCRLSWYVSGSLCGVITPCLVSPLVWSRLVLSVGGQWCPLSPMGGDGVRRLWWGGGGVLCLWRGGGGVLCRWRGVMVSFVFDEGAMVTSVCSWSVFGGTSSFGVGVMGTSFCGLVRVIAICHGWVEGVGSFVTAGDGGL